MGKKDYMELLCNAGEMFALLSGSLDTEKILQRCVVMVAAHLKADVCSIYLLDKSRTHLILRATKGLSATSVDNLKLKVGEGLVGKTMATMEMVMEENASSNPDFKYFPSANEEEFECFLGIPILRGRQGIGVLVVQRKENQMFSNEEAMVLRSIASQLALILENARVLLSFKEGEAPKESLNEAYPALPSIISAKIGSRGIAIGRAVVVRKNPVLEMLRGMQDISDGRKLGINELDKAIAMTVSQIESLELEVSRRLPEAVTLIFDAHIMILKDKGFSGAMKELTVQGQSALESVVTVARQYINLFGSSPNEYLRDKVVDVEDIAIRLIENLLRSGKAGSGDQENRILVARDLLPSEAARFIMRGGVGIIMVGGGLASHAAILARSFGIPMLITDEMNFLSIEGEPAIIMDAEVGNIYFNPDHSVEEQFLKRISSSDFTDKIPEKESRTADGTPVSLMVNINLLSEIEPALKLNASGVGLYRSEFPFLVRNNLPSDTEQFRVYDMLLTKMAGKEVTVRTLDVGGDKVLSYFENAGEANPELGLRSIRFALRYPDILEQQIMAILVAGAEAAPGTRLRIMFPMISSLDDFLKAKEIVIKCCSILNSPGSGERALELKNGISVKMPEIGMMIELPSVVEIIDSLIQKADFFSIGTNDFVQYMLAADRTNDRVAEYYAPHHPGVLRAINRVASAVVAAGKDISVCGEMAKEPAFIPFFLGIGIRKLSVNQHFLFNVQKCIRRWRIEDAKRYASSLLSRSSVKEVQSLLDMNY